MALAVQGVQNVIGYTFADPYLVREAVSAAGSIVAAGPRRFPNGNKRLALLGDTILQLALAEDWYDGTEPRGMRDHSITVLVVTQTSQQRMTVSVRALLPTTTCTRLDSRTTSVLSSISQAAGAPFPPSPWRLP